MFQKEEEKKKKSNIIPYRKEGVSQPVSWSLHKQKQLHQ